MATTIAELSDLIAEQQREINDIEVILSNQGQTLTDHGTDITDLQNPPSGVPAPLLEWLGTHTIREVDTILDADIIAVVADVSTNTTDISDLTTALAQEVTDRTDADTALAAVDTDLQVQITDNLATLTQEISDRGALAVTTSEGLDTVNTRVDDLESTVAALSVSGSTDSASMSSQLAATNAALQVAQTQITLLQGIGVDPSGAQASQITALTILANDASTDVAQEIVDRAAADNVLQLAIDTVNSSITGLNTSISDEASTRSTADLAIQSDVAALTAEISGHGALISAETAARVAADAVLTTDVSDNTTDITDLQTGASDEVTNREAADVVLQTAIDTNTTDIDTNTTDIATNSADITQINAKFSVVKDGSGFVTGWRDIAELAAAGAFKLKDLNNDARLQNPGYVGKYFAPVAMISFAPDQSYDADYGGSTSTDFTGSDANDYTRLVKVYSTLTIGINGSCFSGVDYSTGGSLQRLGQVLTTFKVDFSGTVNRFLSLWYRIKDAPADNTQRWLPVAYADSTVADGRTYEYARGQAVVQISVTSDKVIEFGLTVLNTLDASIEDSSASFIYGGSVSVTALNMVTIS